MSRPPRLAGFEYVGNYSYFLTLCTHRRFDAFREDDLARLVIGQIRRTARTFSFAILAYCVMPDHVHLLLQGRTAASDLRRFTKQFKQSTGQRYAHHTGGRLWQEGYYDRVLRPEEPEALVARYIIENPVRAGLVERPTEYPYLGSEVWNLDEIEHF
jgi:putative transposase